MHQFTRSNTLLKLLKLMNVNSLFVVGLCSLIRWCYLHFIALILLAGAMV